MSHYQPSAADVITLRYWLTDNPKQELLVRLAPGQTAKEGARFLAEKFGKERLIKVKLFHRA